MARINDIDRRVLNALTGRERIKMLLGERNLTLKQFAEKHNEWADNVSRCISGDRPLLGIRDKIAKELNLSRAQVDDLIDGDRR